MRYFFNFLHRIKRAIRNRSKKLSYWEKRSELYYYNVVRDWIDECSPGDWILDVGARDTPIVKHGSFTRRSMLDIRPFDNNHEGIEQIESDWLMFKMPQNADLVLCLQVLEHLPDEIVGPFSRKLLDSGKNIIISVPYKWPKGFCKWHQQDPVDIDKLERWTQREADRYYVEERDQDKRLIALYQRKC